MRNEVNGKHRKMDCMDHPITVKEDRVNELQLKVEPKDGEAEEFIQDISGKSLGEFSEELEPKDGSQEVDGSVVIDMFKRFDEETKEFIQEDNTTEAEYFDELESEIFPNTSDEEFISEPKKSVPRMVKAENRKSECFSQRATGIKNEESITDQKLARIPFEKKTSYICIVCGKIFKIQYSLNLHMNIHKDIKPHDCKTCGRNFAQKPHLARHMRTHNGERPYKCSYCPAAFADVSSQRVHHRTHTNERPYVCDICGKSFPTNYLSKHRRDVHNMIGNSVKPHESNKPKPYKCEICEHSFAQKAHLNRHMRTHTGERPYKCSYCPATFPDSSTVKMHHRTHTNERPYVCGICGKSFTTNVLKKHEKKEHNKSDTGNDPHRNIKPKPYECEICERAFTQKPHLTRHMRTHTGERPYKCTYCPATFPDSRAVKNHHRTHTNERPYVCGICGKSFTTNVLKKHEKEVHNLSDTGNKPHRNIKPKPYECEICERAFTQKPHLTRHMRTHTGERPYKCTYCPATFPDSSTVRKHHRTHTNERPYTCDICDKSFTSNVLKRHKRVAHNITDFSEKPHESARCEICERNFTQKANLMRHMKRAHPADFQNLSSNQKHGIHTGEKTNENIEKPNECDMHKNLRPYVCDVCGKSFTYSITLKLHKMIHTGEKPYVRDVCGTGFINYAITS